MRLHTTPFFIHKVLFQVQGRLKAVLLMYKMQGLVVGLQLSYSDTVADDFVHFCVVDPVICGMTARVSCVVQIL